MRAARMRRDVTAGFTVEEEDEEDREEEVGKGGGNDARVAPSNPAWVEPKWAESLRRSRSAPAHRAGTTSAQAAGAKKHEEGRTGGRKAQSRGQTQGGAKPKPAGLGRRSTGGGGVVHIASSHLLAELLMH